MQFLGSLDNDIIIEDEGEVGNRFSVDQGGASSTVKGSVHNTNKSKTEGQRSSNLQEFS